MHVYRLGYVIVCLYIARSPYEVDRPKNIMLTIKRTDARIRKYGKEEDDARMRFDNIID